MRASAAPEKPEWRFFGFDTEIWRSGGDCGRTLTALSPPLRSAVQPWDRSRVRIVVVVYEGGALWDRSCNDVDAQSGDLAASLESAGELVRDLWGHLPERQRQQILQPLSEEFLPKYAAEIEAYFRTLAAPDHRALESP